MRQTRYRFVLCEQDRFTTTTCFDTVASFFAAERLPGPSTSARARESSSSEAPVSASRLLASASNSLASCAPRGTPSRCSVQIWPSWPLPPDGKTRKSMLRGSTSRKRLGPARMSPQPPTAPQLAAGRWAMAGLRRS